VGVLGANDFDRFVLSDSFFIDTISLSGIFLDVSVLDLDMFPDDDLVGVVFVSMDFSFSLVVVVLFFLILSLWLVYSWRVLLILHFCLEWN